MIVNIRIVIVFLFVSILMKSQNASLSVIATQGNYFSNNDFEISWTLGEVVTDTYSTSNNNFNLTQGFEQPYMLKKSDTLIVVEPTVYPNPTNGPLLFVFPLVDNYQIKCFNVIGQLIFEEKFCSNFINLNVEFLSQAYYVFEVKNTSGDFIYRIKILKIN